MSINFLRTQAYRAQGWQPAQSGATFSVTNPATGEEIAQVADIGPEEVAEAVAEAQTAFADWRQRSATDRAKLLHRWYELMVEHADALAELLTAEQGKPLAEAKGEILYGAGFIEWFAEEARRGYGDLIPGHQAGMRIMALRQPVGVVSAITPWNFPNAMITRKAGAALAAGCVMLVKPAEATPLSALALAVLAEKAGIPPGVFQVLPTSQPKAVGHVLTTHPGIRKVSFTGSTAVGKILLKQSADTVKRVSMELGGNAPFIVFDDADIPAAVEGAIASKYRNAGQTCVCANRILVQDAIYDEFVEALTEATRKLKVGPGMEDGVDIGPLINQAGLDKVERLVADAKARGAKVTTGGERHALGGTFYTPTVLEGATMAMELAQTEIFGPVAPVFRFHTEAEAIELANATPFGLAAYFYGRDLGRVWRVAEGLDYGMVGVNTGLISTPVAPFGGMKESGMGREGSKYGMDAYQEIKYVAMQVG